MLVKVFGKPPALVGPKPGETRLKLSVCLWSERWLLFGQNLQ